MKYLKIIHDFILKDGKKTSKRKIVFFLLFLNIITSAAVNIYIPCMRQMALDFNVTKALMQTTIIAYLVGEFSGRLMCGPLIDIHGNKKIILISLMISILGHFGCMVAPTFEIFMAMRFMQAIGASVVYIISMNIVHEIFQTEEEKSNVVGILELYQPIAWILSPFVGSMLSACGSWRLSFLILLLSQFVGLLFFSAYHEMVRRKLAHKYSVSKLLCNYRDVLKNSYFMIYALIPGFFAGGYMIFATSCPFICSQFFGDNSAEIAFFSAIPLVFYVAATFAYRATVRHFGMKIAKRIGTGIYIVFGLYLLYLALKSTEWTPSSLLSLMSIQCAGSAFLVPISVFKALQSSIHAGCVGTSTVIVFRNIIMSLCIAISANINTQFNGSITTIMACVLMTVSTVLVLIMTRRIIKNRARGNQ